MPQPYTQDMNGRTPYRAFRPAATAATGKRRAPGVVDAIGLVAGLVVLASFLASCDNSPRKPLEQATRSILRQQIDQHGRYLSADALGGRHFASAEAESAGAYLLRQCNNLGIRAVDHAEDLLGSEPASFLHSFGVTLYHLGPRNKVAMQLATRSRDEPEFLGLGEDFLPLLHSRNARVVGTLVTLTGSGALHSNPGDLRDRIVLVGHRALEPEEGESLETTLFRTTRQLEARGVAAVVFAGLETWQRLRTSRYPSQLPQEQIDLARSPRGQRTNMHADRLVLNTQSVAWRLAPQSTIPAVVLGPGAWRSWEAGAEVGIAVDLQQEVSLGQNILVGFGGQNLQQEVLLLVAHVDHAGINSAGDILNGADDNASGVAALLEITRALTTVAPRLQRSVLVAFVSGELHGVQGSQTLLRDFCMLLGDRQLTSAIVLDGIGRNGADRIVLDVTTGSADQQRAFEHHNQRASLLAPALLLAPAPGNPTAQHTAGRAPPRSPEHTAEPRLHPNSYELFVWAGIPSVLLNDGLDPFLYGQPEDDWKRIDTHKVARVARLVFRVTYELATLPGSQTLPASHP